MPVLTFTLTVRAPLGEVWAFHDDVARALPALSPPDADVRVESADDLVPTLRRAFDLDTSCVVEIPIDYRENVRFSERIGDLRKVEEGVA